MNQQTNPVQSTPAVSTFTRRSFMKTSALTVGAVALLSQGRALADGGGNSSSMLLVCIDEPEQASYSAAWPATFAGARRRTQIHHTTDHNFEGVVWDLYHWVEIDGNPKQRDSVPSPGQMKGHAMGHLVITRSFWTYTREERTGWQYPGVQYTYFVDVKDQWVTRTVVHLTAGGIGESNEHYMVYTNFEHEMSFSDMTAASNTSGCYQLTWGGDVIGWAAVSVAVDDFGLRSDAFFMPYKTKKEFSYEGNLSVDIKAVTLGGSAQSVFNVNEEPPHSPILLNWQFVVRDNVDGIDPPIDWQPPNPPIALPQNDL